MPKRGCQRNQEHKVLRISTGKWEKKKMIKEENSSSTTSQYLLNAYAVPGMFKALSTY